MEKLNQKIRQLNQLLLINYQSERIYLKALESTNNLVFQQFFRARAFERNEFCRYLAAEIKQIGGLPNFNDDVKPTNIKWPNLKKAILNKDSKALLNEIKRLKNICSSFYKKTIMECDLKGDILNVLQYQNHKIESFLTYSTITDLTSSENSSTVIN